MVLALSLEDLVGSGGSKRVKDLIDWGTGRSLLTVGVCRAMMFVSFEDVSSGCRDSRPVWHIPGCDLWNGMSRRARVKYEREESCCHGLLRRPSHSRDFMCCMGDVCRLRS